MQHKPLRISLSRLYATKCGISESDENGGQSFQDLWQWNEAILRVGKVCLDVTMLTENAENSFSRENSEQIYWWKLTKRSLMVPNYRVSEHMQGDWLHDCFKSEIWDNIILIIITFLQLFHSLIVYCHIKWEYSSSSLIASYLEWFTIQNNGIFLWDEVYKKH